MSFAAPLVLLALLAIPVLIVWYASHQRARRAAAQQFVAPALAESVAPVRPAWRRHLPMAVFAVALAVLILAAARPQQSVAVAVNDAAVVLANDVSSSMAATDVTPSRLVAAEHAGAHFLTSLPTSVRVGLLQFNERAAVLQSPTTDRSLVRSALSQLRAGGHTAIGDGILTALHMLSSLPKEGGKSPPGAIVLLSDGTSTNGADPLAAARQARAQHVPIYTVVLGTDRGTIPIRQRKRTVNQPVPPSPSQLEQIARLSGGQAFNVGDAGRLNQVYSHLGRQLSHKHVNHEITASFAGGAMVLLLIGSGLSLVWFGRLV
jgi:Ca-activated chloride channel family protein